MKYFVFWSEAFLKSSSILTVLRMTLAFEQHRFNVDTMVSTLLDVHTIIKRSLLLTSSFSPFFPSYTLLSFTFLFNLFCFSSLCQICQRIVLLNLLDTKVNPDCLLFQRERENRGSPVVRGWSGGAMMLGKISVPKRPTYLINSRARTYCACSRCEWGLF